MKKKSAVLGAAFLMATSAIGPGFLTQTAVFTSELLTSFGFVILISVFLDIGAQLNIWRILTISGKRAQDLANELLPGLGLVLAACIGFGSLIFNIGNFAGAGLGLQVLSGIEPVTGAALSCLLALAIFWYREAGWLMDNLTKLLGLLMILLTIFVAIQSHPPVSAALYRTIWPEKIDAMKIVTLVGGTVGGYISFAGAHRLLDAGISGRAAIPQVNRSAVSGILLTSLMRFILFFAALGVVMQGVVLDISNPSAAVFRYAAGNIGFHFFGVVMWCAAITSIVGASYTTISFFKTLHQGIRQHEKLIVSVFIVISAGGFALSGKPVSLLILAGAVNGIILPLALTVILIASNKPQLLQGYKHPLFLKIGGWLVVAAMSWMGWLTIRQSVLALWK